jgi:hypothetical protein
MNLGRIATLLSPLSCGGGRKKGKKIRIEEENLFSPLSPHLLLAKGLNQ